MHSFKVIVEEIDPIDESEGISIDVSGLDSRYELPILVSDPNTTTSPEERAARFTSFSLIAKSIQSYIDSIIEKEIEDNTKDESVDEVEIISDKKRISELDMINKIREKYKITGYLNKVIKNGEELSKADIGHFSYTYLNSIIIQGTKHKNETMFENTSDLNYELYFGSHVIKRANCEFDVDEI